ncbi:hypothetical protein ACFV99_23770 [Streptomyces sp. NPDC059944]|uniref:hypothetical protein n=1 Tax=unclassified Streptomyces TaxID=2593676 RepID=UPI003655E379
MSDDYAALISTIIIAALLVGTVQIYSLTRAWVDVPIEMLHQYLQANGRALASIRAGDTPAADDLSKLAAITNPKDMWKRAWPAMVAAGIWLWTCIVLVALQIRILLWSATGAPKDPALAKGAFFITSAVVVMLVLEGIIRVLARGIHRLWQALVTTTETPSTSDERAQLHQALAGHVRDTGAATINNEPSP